MNFDIIPSDKGQKITTPGYSFVKSEVKAISYSASKNELEIHENKSIKIRIPQNEQKRLEAMCLEVFKLKLVVK